MYPYHIGRQKGTIKPLQPTGLTLKKELMSDHLKSLGYKTHVVGKWHLGFCRLEFTPTWRGFDSFRGFYTGAEHHYSHKRSGFYDFRVNNTVDGSVQGKYSTDIFTHVANNVIKEHKSSSKKSEPLFLYVPFQSVHAPLEAPKVELKRLKQRRSRRRRSLNEARQIFRAMMARVDKGVYSIANTLKREGMWDNTILGRESF